MPATSVPDKGLDQGSGTHRLAPRQRFRRLLLDMHIPDWDEAFLSAFDPEAMASTWSAAGVESVMLYCLSHVGLAYWPSGVGPVHGALGKRDLVGESVAACKRLGLETFAYYSAIFNNRAWIDHPDWRIVPSAPVAKGSFMGKRYGHLCPNNAEYRRFALAQVDELAGNYPFDGFFFDMTFWPAICLCPSCRERFRSEAGQEIPETVDWFSQAWCRFQSARERWMSEFALLLSAEVKKIRPKMPVYHNSAVLLFNWSRGLDFDHAGASDFLGGDFYGDELEQQMTSRFMNGLSKSRPVEFMTSRTLHLQDHAQSKSRTRIEMQSLAALGSGAAIRFIDAVDPIGTVNPGAYRQLGDIFSSLAPLEQFIGGDPVEDIAVYMSDRSKMSFEENGHSIGDPGLRSGFMPHLDAARGAVRALQRAHLPFGIVTRKALSRLGDYCALILPDVLRMDEEEMAAVRAYVLGGGRLYASRFTSLTMTDGRRLENFGLADLFGCEVDGGVAGVTDRCPSLPGSIAYIEAKDPELSDAISPQPLLSQPLTRNGTPGLIALHPVGTRAPADGERASADGGGRTRVLATLKLPYAWPDEGSVEDRRWASIHSSPPWTDTGLPVVVEHEAGRGRVIYSAADIETVDHWAHERFFLALVRRLLGDEVSFGTDAHPCVWMNVFRQPEKRRYEIFFLNYQVHEPVIPLVDISFRLRLPAGLRALSLVSAPEMEAVEFICSDSGTVSARLDKLDLYRILLLDY